jgi:hypothetical protein
MPPSVGADLLPAYGTLYYLTVKYVHSRFILKERIIKRRNIKNGVIFWEMQHFHLCGFAGTMKRRRRALFLTKGWIIWVIDTTVTSRNMFAVLQNTLLNSF